MWEVRQRVERSAPSPSDVPFSVTAMMASRWSDQRQRGGTAPSAARYSEPGGGPDEAANDALEERIDDALEDAGMEPVFGEDPMSPDCGPIPLSYCGDPPSGERRRYEDVGFVAADSDTHDGPFRLVGEWSGCEEQMMEQVWALLRENLGLVDWAMCLAQRMHDPFTDFGPNGDSECVVERIRGQRDRPVKVEWETGCGWRMITRSDHRIGICKSLGESGQIAAELYCGGTPSERMCALVSMAASLLHELTHTCGYSHRGDEYTLFNPEKGDDKLPCSFPYLTGDLFAWAMTQRYPQMLRSGCCSPWDERYGPTSPVGGQGDLSDPLPGLSSSCLPGPPVGPGPSRPHAPPGPGWVPPVDAPRDPWTPGNGELS